MDEFYKMRDDNNLQKIRALCDELPYYVREFIIGIQMRTSSLTRLSYAYDLRIFFDYLSKKVFVGKKSMQIELSDLETLRAFDIEVYMDYLSSYEFNGKKYQCGERAKERKLCSLRSFFKYFFNNLLISCRIFRSLIEKINFHKLIVLL